MLYLNGVYSVISFLLLFFFFSRTSVDDGIYLLFIKWEKNPMNTKREAAAEAATDSTVRSVSLVESRPRWPKS